MFFSISHVFCSLVFLFFLFFFACVSLLIFLRFFTFGQVKGNARYGRSIPPIDQSFRVYKVNLVSERSQSIVKRSLHGNPVSKERKILSGVDYSEIILSQVTIFLTYAWFLRLRVRNTMICALNIWEKKQIRTYIWQNKRRDILSTQVFHDQKDDELFRSTSLFQIESFQLLKHFLERNT